MQSKLDKLRQAAGSAANEAVRVTGDLVNKANDKASELAISAKISKLQRQLGALVYALRKNGEENEPMIQWYMTEIDRLKTQMPENRAPYEASEPAENVHFYGKDAGEEENGAMFCTGDSDELP